jgi:uncharacterized OB-fold protein
VNVATLHRIHARRALRNLKAMGSDCDQCGAQAHAPCRPDCPYVRAHHYPKEHQHR